LTHTARTLAAFRERGFLCGMVERFIPQKPHGKRVDLYGIIDILAIDRYVTIGIQSCGQDFAAHRQKMIEAESTGIWLSSPYRMLQLWGWRKVKKKRGGKQMIYQPRICHIFLKDNEVCWYEER